MIERATYINSVGIWCTRSFAHFASEKAAIAWLISELGAVNLGLVTPKGRFTPNAQLPSAAVYQTPEGWGATYYVRM